MRLKKIDTFGFLKISSKIWIAFLIIFFKLSSPNRQLFTYLNFSLSLLVSEIATQKLTVYKLLYLHLFVQTEVQCGVFKLVIDMSRIIRPPYAPCPPMPQTGGSKPFRFINSKLIKIMPAAVTEAKRPESYLIRKVLGCSEPVRNGRFNLQITLTLSPLLSRI